MESPPGIYAHLDKHPIAESPYTKTLLGISYLVSNHLLKALDSSKLQNWSSIIGIVTAIIGNVLISVALNVQRYAHVRIRQASQHSDDQGESGKAKGRRPRSRATSHASQASHVSAQRGGSIGSTEEHNEKAPGDEEPKSYLRSPYWWIGITLMTIGEMGNFLAYGFAPASIVAPLGVVALVSNCVIAPLVLHEHFRARDFLGVVVAAAGAVVVVLSANESNARLGPNELAALILRWEFALYSAITICLIGVGMWASDKYGKKTMVIDLGLVGLFGGYTVLSTKGVASLLSSRTWHVLTYPITYILVLVLVVTALMQVRYVNRALQRFSSVRVIPGQYVAFTISVVIGSAILYRDFETTTAAQIGKFIAGCALTFGGVFLLSSGKKEDDHAEHEGIEREEQDRASLGETHDLKSPHRLSTSSSVDGRGVTADAQPRTPMNRGSISFKSTGSARRSRRESEQENPSVTIYSGPTADERTPLVSEAPRSGRSSGSATPIDANDDHLRPPTTPRAGTWSRRQSSGTERPSFRQSISHLAAPLTSPLSASLAAVVADANRRGVEAVISPAKRGSETSRSSQARYGLKKSRSQGMSEPTVVADETGAVVLPYDPREAEDSPLGPKKSMSKIRHVGERISDLFSKGDGEPGPSERSRRAPERRGTTDR